MRASIHFLNKTENWQRAGLSDQIFYAHPCNRDEIESVHAAMVCGWLSLSDPAPGIVFLTFTIIKHMRSQNIRTRLRAILWQYHPSAFLLAAQLVFLILYAVFNESHGGRIIISAFGILVLVLVVWVVSRSPATNWIAWVLAVTAFLLTILSILFVNPMLVSALSLVEGVLYFYAAGSMIAYMLGDYKVTVDELFAAGSTFTLFAWGYAHFYLVCQTLVPGSFISTIDQTQELNFIEFLFVSFTNLSATGLGDITPIAAPARVLVMLEQFTGVGYIAVVVSRLIGLSISKLERG